jgi:Mn2+/Fe2+ NRAMP family transporter
MAFRPHHIIPPLEPLPPPEHGRKLHAFVRGVVAGAADLDPAAVLTATVAGATFGYSVGWVVLLSIPVLWSVFSVSARIGRDSRKGLVELVREQYGRKLALALAIGVFVVNFAMIIGDLVAVSDALSIVTGQWRAFFLVPLAFVVWYMLIVGDTRKSMERLGLLSLFLIAYVVAACYTVHSPSALARGILLPHLEASSAYAMAVIAVFGSLLTPDVIIWQTSSKREIPQGTGVAADTESHAGTFVATLISLSAIVVAASFRASDPSEMTTRSASLSLAFLGSAGPLLFALGILGSGMVALPLLAASLSFSISEAIGWDSGLNKEPWEARYFYIVISTILVVSVVISLFGVDTVRLLYWSQVGAGALVVPILAFLMLLGRNQRVVRSSNRLADDLCLFFALVAMLFANAYFAWAEWIVPHL